MTDRLVRHYADRISHISFSRRQDPTVQTILDHEETLAITPALFWPQGHVVTSTQKYTGKYFITPWAFFKVVTVWHGTYRQTIWDVSRSQIEKQIVHDTSRDPVARLRAVRGLQAILHWWQSPGGPTLGVEIAPVDPETAREELLAERTLLGFTGGR